MRRHGALAGLLLVLALLVGGVALLFQLRVAHGDVFPPYSSLRADPLGTRALHDALARMPGLRVERWFRPFAELEPRPPRTIVYAGLWARGWNRVRREDFDAVDAALRAGSRVVIALRAQAADDELARHEAERAKEREREKQEAGKAKADRTPPVAYADLKRRWGTEVKERMLLERAGGAVRTAEASAAALPETIPWRSDVFFELESGADWTVLYRRASRPVLIERRIGAGTLVLAADAYFLSNEALQQNRAPALLAWVVGPHARVVFDETHLGVAAQPGVAALARRYGLSGAFFTLLLLAALFVWRRMAWFVPPPAAEEAEVALTYHPAAGLEALLRRSVAPGELAAACTAEWQPTARESDRARVEAALAAAPKSAAPAARYNAAVRALQRRPGARANGPT